MPDDRQPGLRGLAHESGPAGLPGGVDLREAREVPQRLLAGVEPEKHPSHYSKIVGSADIQPEIGATAERCALWKSMS